MIKAAIAALAVFSTAMTSVPSNAAEIRLLSAAALMYAFNELLPQFEKATGNRVRAD
jgi:ABC-type molybdate transport system substrate-binding protein